MKKLINVVTTDKANFSDLHSENMGMIKALEKQGLTVSLVSWHDLLEKFNNADANDEEAFIIRTVWDYPEYLEKFKRFIRQIKRKSIVAINPAEIIEWNLNKKYLFDLQNAGIPIVPCEFLSAGSRFCRKYKKSVVKPVIGLGACGAQLLHKGDTITVGVDSLVNPFRESIHNGELSIVMISGKPEFYIKKIPASSDWRVQPQYGGEYMFEETVPDEASNVCKTLYQYVLEKFKSDYLLFMRIDLIQNDAGEWEVLEFEAIDPSLYGAISSAAVDALAVSLQKLLEKAEFV